MDSAELLDSLFRQAVSAIDAGDISTLEALLRAHPKLARERLDSPGAWLREKVGDTLEGFFQRPYLLWFIAEDPVRNGKLPGNIVDVARLIIRVAKREAANTVQEQLDYALRLICWSWIARECGVQIDLIEVLLGAGASMEGLDRFGSNTDAAIYNGNFAAAEYLLKRGASVTLSTALVLERWSDVDRLVQNATLAEKQDAFVLAALKGKAEALRKMLALGVAPTTVSAQTQSHGTALHHAVWSGSLEAVKVLVEAGADLGKRDSIYKATPLGWARYGDNERKENPGARRYSKIIAYLCQKGAAE